MTTYFALGFKGNSAPVIMECENLGVIYEAARDSASFENAAYFLCCVPTQSIMVIFNPEMGPEIRSYSTCAAYYVNNRI